MMKGSGNYRSAGLNSPDISNAGLSRASRAALIAVFSVFLLIHLTTLSIHPFVHSDEAWLASLTRAMGTQSSFAATEDVFRLTMRSPHALKTLYHLLQQPFLAVSWSVFSARLPSLIAGMFSLAFMVRIAGNLGMGPGWRYLPALLMAVDPQFWYLSHLARQEMILILLLLFSWDLKGKGFSPVQTALPIAAAVFVHPNAFIIALPMGALYLLDCFTAPFRKSAIRSLLIYIAIPALAAAAAVGISFMMDHDFIGNYRRFGDTVGAGDSWVIKFLGLPEFLVKMAQGRAGTYYLTDVRPFFLLGGIGAVLLLIRSFTCAGHRVCPMKISGLFLVPVSILIGMAAVGKYGPPTIGFLLPVSYLIFGCAMDDGGLTRNGAEPGRFSGYIRFFHALLALSAFGMLSGITTAELIGSARETSYREYRDFLRENTSFGNNSGGREISADGMVTDMRVLGNLNTAFAFDYDRLLIWRDLDALHETGRSLEDVIDHYDVKWICVPDELEFIYLNRPVWNSLYGNPRWYPELTDLLEGRGELVAEGSFPNYAMRIVPFMGREDWKLRIYRIE